MSQPHSLAADYAVYLLVRIVVCVIQALPLRAAYTLAEALAWLAYRIDRRHRAVAFENIHQAFPGRFTDAECDALVQRVYRHFCTLVIEIMHIPRRLHVHNWKRHVEMRDGRCLLDLMLSGRPLMFVTSHFGNWEMGGYILGMLGFTSHAIARPLDNPYLDRFLRDFRERTGQKLLAKKGDFDQIQAILQKGGMIATLGDQDAGQRGLFVDFFGRPASTHKAIALLCLEHRVPLVVTSTRRVGGPLQYEIGVEDVILPEEYDGRPDAVPAITQRFTTGIEKMVRSAPEQYFWLHRRWKHQPARARRRVA